MSSKHRAEDERDLANDGLQASAAKKTEVEAAKSASDSEASTAWSTYQCYAGQNGQAAFDKLTAGDVHRTNATSYRDLGDQQAGLGVDYFNFGETHFDAEEYSDAMSDFSESEIHSSQACSRYTTAIGWYGNANTCYDEALALMQQ